MTYSHDGHLRRSRDFITGIFNQQAERIRELERELRACQQVLRLHRPITHGHHCSCGICVRLRAVEHMLEGGS